jgi:hypothetical protein
VAVETVGNWYWVVGNRRLFNLRIENHCDPLSSISILDRVLFLSSLYGNEPVGFEGPLLSPDGDFSGVFIVTPSFAAVFSSKTPVAGRLFAF